MSKNVILYLLNGNLPDILKKPLLAAHNISIVRHGKSIIDNVSLAMLSHDFITIVGPNGAGKTMLLKALLGLIKIDSGHIDKKNDIKISYVPQRLLTDSIIPLKAGRFLTLGKKYNEDKRTAVIERTNIAAILAKPLYSLSGGELQRLLLARALIMEPDLLVLDEPAQNLDINSQMEFYKLIAAIYQNSNISILMVSHDLHMVMVNSREVVCLYHHVCCYGKPQKVAQDPEFIKLFGNEMAQMMAVYHHSHNHQHKHD